jgi:hypothetical protein
MPSEIAVRATTTALMVSLAATSVNDIVPSIPAIGSLSSLSELLSRQENFSQAFVVRAQSETSKDF